MRSNYYQHKQRSNKAHRPHSGSQSYVWRIMWTNPRVNNGHFQYRSFRNKADALIFKSRLESNYYNTVWDVEKVSC